MIGVAGEMCSRCRKTTHDEYEGPVTWRCAVCLRPVCGRCTLTIPNRTPREYYEQTLCSQPCWEQAGRPED